MNSIANYRQNVPISILILFQFFSCAVNKRVHSAGANLAADPVSTGVSAGKTSTEPDFTKLKADSTLFNVYKLNDRYYYEIPDSLLGRDMLAVTRLSRAPEGLVAGEPPYGGKQYGGQQENSQVWQWELRQHTIFIRVQSFSTKADSSGLMFRAVQNSSLSTILASFQVLTRNKENNGLIIDITDFYNGDVGAISINDELKKAYKTSALDNSRSYINTIKSFPVNIESTEIKTFKSILSPSDNSNESITFELHTSMLLLPRVPMKARIFDPRVAYMSSDYTDYDADDQHVVTSSFINRFKLEPKDEAAYQRGEYLYTWHGIYIKPRI